MVAINILMMADSITIKFDFAGFIKSIEPKFKKIRDPEYLLRPVAIELIPLMTRRIHINGKAADGSSIGTYSDSYMRERARHKRTEPQNKVVVALTSKLENDWTVVPTEKGYGIGFLTDLSAKKARWVEGNFGKDIFSLSAAEEKFAFKRLNELINDAFSL